MDPKADEVAAVLAKGEEYLLIDLNGPLPDLSDEAERGYAFLGVLARVGGRAAARCEPGLNAAQFATFLAASVGFAQQLAGVQKPGDDFAQFMERLWQLPDAREEN